MRFFLWTASTQIFSNIYSKKGKCVITNLKLEGLAIIKYGKYTKGCRPLHHYVVLRAAGHDYTFRIVNGLKVPPRQKIVPKTIHDTLFVLLQPYDCFPSEM